MRSVREIDCLVVGGGPGGLTVATYLSRFRRSVTLIDAGESRLQLVPRAHNFPGFPDGIGGPDLHARMRTHASLYGAELIVGQVTACVRDGDTFVVHTSQGDFRAKALVLATGSEVTDPEMPDLKSAVARGLIRYCPVCDGFEAIGARIGVLGGRPGAIEEAHFLRTFSEDVTFVPARDGELSDIQVQRARYSGISIEQRPCARLATRENAVEVHHASGACSVFDIVYPCLGYRPRGELAELLGAHLSDEGELLTDEHQATSVSGLYAVGDVLRGLDQIASACGQAAIAATAIHNRFRAEVDQRS